MTATASNAQSLAGNAFAEAVGIMARLRGPEGCPWDREQSFASIRKYTLEETYEVLDAIDRRDWPNLEEELGDLLLQILFYAQMATDFGYFAIDEVIAGLNRKLIRRHPHVFGEAASIAAGNAASDGMKTRGIDSGQVLRNWDQIKQAEKVRGSAGTQSRLDAVARNLPALMEASKLGSKAAKYGFDWPDTEGVFAKMEEETAELKAAIERSKRGQVDLPRQESGDLPGHDVESEVGDLLFTVVNLARHVGIDAELALHGANEKFRRRFAAMEQLTEVPLEQQPAAQLEFLWAEVKRVESASRDDAG